jgi:tetratricopeptide (TPR) repeat protein
MKQFNTGAVIEDGRGGACFFQDDYHEEAFWLPARDEVLAMPFRVHDAWSSRNGSAYLAVEAKWPIVRVTKGRFEHLPLEADSSACRICGRSGGSDEDDELFLVANDRLHWRVGGRWASARVGAGDFRSLAVGPSDVFCATGPRGGAGRLFRCTGDSVEVIAPPATEENATAVGLALNEGGDLLAIYGGVYGGPVRPWVRRADSAWSPLECRPSMKPWLSQVRCRTWNGVTYLPATNGIFVWDGGTRIRRADGFSAVSLWPWGKELICRGWRDGTAFHLVGDGKEWRPLLVPEPEVVFGGFGKVIWLGKGHKVPVRKIRLPAPTTRRTTKRRPASKELPAFSLSQYLADLSKRAGTRRRREPFDAVKEVEAALGTSMAPDLRALIKLHGDRSMEIEAGMWRIWDPPRTHDVSLESWVAANYVEQSDLIALFSDTIALGADYGGQVYFAEVAPKRSEIFLNDPSTSGLAFLADSFTSLACLNARDEQWAEVCERTGFDHEDVEANEAPADVVAPFRKAAREFKNKVNLTESSEYDAQWTVLGGRVPRAKPKSDTIVRFKKNKGLLLLFYIAKPDMLHRTNIGARPRNANEPPSAKLRRLWYSYLFEPPEKLNELLDALRRDPAGRVSRTVELLRVVTSDARKLPKPIERFRALRALALARKYEHEEARPFFESTEPVVEPRPADLIASANALYAAQRYRDALRAYRALPSSDARRLDVVANSAYAAQQLGRHAEAARGFERACRLAPDRAHLWRAACFSLWSLKKWDAVERCARRAIRLEPQSGYAWRQLGLAKHEKRDYRAAIDAFRRSVDLDPRDGYSFMSLAYALERTNDPDYFSHMKRALELNPELRADLAKNDRYHSSLRRRDPRIAALAK